MSHFAGENQSSPEAGEFVRFFRRAVRPWRGVYLGMFVGVLLITVAGYVLPIIQKRLINALTGREGDGIWYLFIATGLLMLLIRTEALLRQRVVNSTVHKVMFRLKSRITDRLLDLPPGLLDQLGGGYLSGRLANDVSQLQIFFSNTLFTAMTNILK
ncbi:MAG: ABC transporter ATP-binding protein, partial [Lentisphaeria bacterium]|nr:ABC transporter ATP-binding protein [Lentisphaeria bacterium]